MSCLNCSLHIRIPKEDPVQEGGAQVDKVVQEGELQLAARLAVQGIADQVRFLTHDDQFMKRDIGPRTVTSPCFLARYTLGNSH